MCRCEARGRLQRCTASKYVKYPLLCNEFKGVYGHSEEVHLNDPAPREGRAGELALQPGHPPHHYGGRQCPGLSFYSFRENYTFILQYLSVFLCPYYVSFSPSVSFSLSLSLLTL